MSELNTIQDIVGQNPSSLPRKGFTMRETGKIIGISYMSVHRLHKRGLLRASLALRKKIFTMEEIERFLRETV